MAEKNTEGMVKRRQEESAAKKSDISAAIDKLVKDKQPINVSSIARQAKCSKNTVRKHDDLMARIEGLRSTQSKKKGAGLTNKQKKADDRMIALHERNKELEEKIAQVTEQLIDQTELELEIDRLKVDNIRLVKKNTELEALRVELVREVEKLTKILEKRRNPNAVLSLITSSQQEVAATKKEDTINAE